MNSKILLFALFAGGTTLSGSVYGTTQCRTIKTADCDQKQHTDQNSTCLFHTPDKKGIPYRIPAIITTHSGRLIAMSDYRYCGADIGFGQIDIVGKYSDDNGKTWSNQFDIAKGNGIKNDFACGYGDAATVADHKKKDILLMCCTGNVTYWNSTRKNPLRVARLYSKDNGKTWTAPQDITEEIYALFDGRKNGPLKKLFIGSGKIAQSNLIKAGKNKRIYAALCTDGGNFVIYSDNLGMQWHVLGGVDQSPAPKGDEPKCEELPNGDVLLSSRKGYGRFYNIFSYTNKKKAEGSWSEPVASHNFPGGIKTGANATNGEVGIYPVVRNSDGKKMHLIIQSLPIADQRADVAIYYKALVSESDYATPAALSSNWEGSFQVSHTGSAYSTFCLQQDNKIGFFYEEEPGYYNMVYRPISIEEITSGKYTIRK